MKAFLGDDDSVACVVVLNQRSQFSIWPADRQMPSGWSAEGFSGSRADCVAHIATVWPDPTTPSDRS